MRKVAWKCIRCAHQFNGRGEKCPKCGGLVRRDFSFPLRYKHKAACN